MSLVQDPATFGDNLGAAQHTTTSHTYALRSEQFLVSILVSAGCRISLSPDTKTDTKICKTAFLQILVSVWCRVNESLIA
jgi:hypothetical protein